MSNVQCDCVDKCSVLSIVGSVIIGIITTILFCVSAIEMTAAFLWTLLGISVVYLALIFALIPWLKNNSCVCGKINRLLTGALGTALLSVIMLGVAFSCGYVLSGIFAGITLFFFSLLLTTVGCVIKCVANCDC